MKYCDKSSKQNFLKSPVQEPENCGRMQIHTGTLKNYDDLHKRRSISDDFSITCEETDMGIARKYCF